MNRKLPSYSELENILCHNFLKPINIDKLNTITRGNIELSFSLLTIFKEQAVMYMTSLEQAKKAKSNQLKKMFEAVHAVKGAVLCIGADKAIDLAKALEREIENNNIIDEDDFNALLIEIKEIMNFICVIEAKKEYLLG